MARILLGARFLFSVFGRSSIFSLSDDGFLFSKLWGELLSKGVFLSEAENDALKSDEEEVTEDESRDFFK